MRSKQAHVRMVIVAFFWAGTFIAGKYLSSFSGHALIGTLRFSVAFIFLATWIILRDRKIVRITLSQHVFCCLLGFIGIFLFNQLFFASLNTISAVRGTILMAASPVLTYIVSSFMGQAPLEPVKLAGLALSITGIFMTVSLHGSVVGGWSLGIGDCYMLLAAICWSIYSLLNRQFFSIFQEIPAIHLTAYASFYGLAFLIVTNYRGLLGMNKFSISLEMVGAITYLGIFATGLAYVWYSDGIKVLGSGKAAAYHNLVPIFSFTMAYLLLGEQVGFFPILGGICTVIGVWLINTRFHFSENSKPSIS